jgi:hypothetical protein
VWADFWLRGLRRLRRGLIRYDCVPRLLSGGVNLVKFGLLGANGVGFVLIIFRGIPQLHPKLAWRTFIFFSAYNCSSHHSGDPHEHFRRHHVGHLWPFRFSSSRSTLGATRADSRNC